MFHKENGEISNYIFVVKVEPLYVATPDGSLNINSRNFADALAIAWENSNPAVSHSMPWNIQLRNFTTGYITGEGLPVVAMHYELLLPDGRTLQDTFNTEPAFSEKEQQVSTLGYNLMQANAVYGPDYQFHNVIPDHLSLKEAANRLSTAWARIYGGQPSTPATIQVYLFHRQLENGPGGQPQTSAYYFLFLNDKIVSPASVTQTEYQIVRENLGPRTTLQHVVTVGGKVTKSDFNINAVMNVISSYWEAVNPGK